MEQYTAKPLGLGVGVFGSQFSNGCLAMRILASLPVFVFILFQFDWTIVALPCSLISTRQRSESARCSRVSPVFGSPSHLGHQDTE